MFASHTDQACKLQKKKIRWIKNSFCTLNGPFTQMGQLSASTTATPNGKDCKQLLRQRNFIPRDDWVQLQKHLIKNSFKSKTQTGAFPNARVVRWFVKPFPLYCLSKLQHYWNHTQLVKLLVIKHCIWIYSTNVAFTLIRVQMQKTQSRIKPRPEICNHLL